MKNKSLISIVTVNFNNLDGLISTLDSVFSQDYFNKEVIVIDGGSTDGSKEFIEDKGLSLSYWVSELDEGVYFAMNKGLEKCMGEWVIFMNSGDCFYDSSTLSSIPWHEYAAANLLYGSQSLGGVISHPQEIFDVENGIIPASHQAMFFKPDVRYNTTYKIYSDYDLFARVYISNPSKVICLNKIISKIESRGLSHNIRWQKRLDKYLSVFNNFGFFGVIRAIFYRLQ